MDTPKITKCGVSSCRTCEHIEECNFFISNTTGVRYRPLNIDVNPLNCKSENIVYLIFCKICHFQYVGETKNRLQTRFNKHRSDIRLGKSCQIVHKHFEQTGHGLINCRIIPIEKIDTRPLRQQNLNEEQINQATTKLRQEREKFWIKTLQSAYPFGLNSRVKGVGDFIPSQGNYLNFGGRKRIKKKHSKRKPKRLRNQVECSLRFIERKHRELANTHNYVHYFKTFLYNLPRLKIDKLLQEVKQDQNLEERIKDMVVMIAKAV